MPYYGADLNPRAISVRFEYLGGDGLTVGPGDGAISVDARRTNFRDKLPVQNRGTFDGFNEGPDQVQSMTITIRQENQSITSAVAARIEDFLNKTGLFAGSQDTSDVPGTFRMIITYDSGAAGTKTWEVCEGEYAEAHAFPSNTYALTVRMYTQPTIA